MKPEAFIDPDVYKEQMAGYLADMRAQPSRPQSRIMAPGDREWAEEAVRLEAGIPFDPFVWTEFAELADTLGMDPLVSSVENP